MNENSISAKGERAAIGGYLPQFDEFAWLVYLNLINKKLEWIRVADPKAEKLDDIQFSTYSELHAYQIKWTISGAVVSFSNFLTLIPQLASSWEKIQSDNPGKKIIPHLITNKKFSKNDIIKDENGKGIGSFNDFIASAWHDIKNQRVVSSEWSNCSEIIMQATGLNEKEYIDFISVFDFQADYEKKNFSVSNSKHAKEQQDLLEISRFLFETAADPTRPVQFSQQQIINRLGWEDRFKTTFNHDLVIDLQKYQPIKSTIDLLNAKIREKNNGYIYLIGGPGSGKSTLLTQWSKTISDRIIKYYAFDFTNPSSYQNYHERGSSTMLFFDLVFQLRQLKVYKREILPTKDLTLLREIFAEQLKELGEDYKETGRRTILIIDGLDHIPREYKTTANFLKDLPHPKALPEGVYIILGSQSYELEDLSAEIRNEFKLNERALRIDPLKRSEILQYIASSKIEPPLNSAQQSIIIEKSQGHPLYLSYVIEKIRNSDQRDDILDNFIRIDGDIEVYYFKIWEPILKNQQLIKMLGLMARINGAVNPDFVSEWDFGKATQIEFVKEAGYLFNQSKEEWTFFHNSFRQFLLKSSALNYLTDQFDENENLHYHKELAEFYQNSKTEPYWQKNFHLFMAKEYNLFIEEVTPEKFTEQILNFRPIDEIKQEAKLGINIALNQQNPVLMLRYLFVLAEIQTRLYNISPSAFTEEFLLIEKTAVARRLLRNNNILLSSQTDALEASRLFFQNGHLNEAVFLFNIAYPEFVGPDSIVIENDHKSSNVISLLQEWIHSAAYFLDVDQILLRLNNIQYIEPENRGFQKMDPVKIKADLLSILCLGLIELKKWEDFNKILPLYNLNEKANRNAVFRVLKNAVESALEEKDQKKADQYLIALLAAFNKENTKPTGKILIADMIYKVRADIEHSYLWIEDISQPSKVGSSDIGTSNSMDLYIPLLKFNKLLNLAGKGVPIDVAIPSVQMNSDDSILVNFERKLCMIAQIVSDGLLKKNNQDDILKRVKIIARFYYTKIDRSNKHQYKLNKVTAEYYEILIDAVADLGHESLEILADFLFEEFKSNAKPWTPAVQRSIIGRLLINGFSREKCKMQLEKLEPIMLQNLDIDARINQCREQAKIWILLKDNIKAEKWIRQAFSESIGIGYSKDNQFESWIEWLQKVNILEPDNAAERITWFLGNISHIKQTTEGSAYRNASADLLRASFASHFSAGLRQLKWQLKKGLVEFEESMSLFIEYYILRTDSHADFLLGFELYTKLFLLVSEDHQKHLLKKIMQKGYSLGKDEFLRKDLPQLINAIKTNAIEENRYSYLRTIEDFFQSQNKIVKSYYSDFSLPKKRFPENQEYDSGNTLVLKDGQSKTESEVLAQVINYESLKLLIGNEDGGNSFFEWEKILDKIMHSLSATEIQELAELNVKKRKRSSLFSKLSQAALVLKNTDLALDLSYRSLEYSSEYGWQKHHDGGSRIKALKSLHNIDPELSVKKAFEVFAFDINNDNHLNSYLQYLEDILPLLTNNFKVQDFWPEIFSHIKRVMVNNSDHQNLPNLSDPVNELKDDFLDYMLYLADHRITFIKEKARFLTAHFIHGKKMSLHQYLKSEGVDSNKQSYIANDILMFLHAMRSNALLDYKDTLLQLSLSDNYNIRANAQKVLSSLEIPFPNPKKRDIPFVYTIEMDPYRQINVKKETDPYYPEIDINNPNDLLRHAKFFIEILTQETDIKESNLIYRLHHIMKSLENPKKWEVKHEKRLRTHLEQINLKFPFIRSRIRTAKNALMIAAAELVDAGAIDSGIIDLYFAGYDYATAFFNAIPKPDFITLISERDRGGVSNNWVDRIEENPRLLESMVKFQAMNIIGEYSMVKSLDWGSPTEIYKQQLTTSEKYRKEEYFFGSIYNESIQNYFKVEGTSQSFLIVRNHDFEQYNLQSNWLAINPELARFFNWIPNLEEEKLFSWKDINNNLMAESIYWRSGNIHMNPRKDSEAGEGWFVIISDLGLSQIKNVTVNLFIQKKLYRSKYEETILKEQTVDNIAVHT
jgi:hypothetical protein